RVSEVVTGMAVADISIVPIGTKTTSISKFVARAFKVLQAEKNIKYELTSMGTTIEGDVTEILRIAQKMHEAAFDGEVARILTTIKIDDRRDKPLTIKGKVESLLKQVGR
ncbi:MAG: MTH1187 family thiamine-binding protein, partial [Dehalococcoidales bacterium]|nr:MTH1187 family thiamine-binding protein [Dehalococcoidales bacterium]